jgi:hypothetical protein
MLQILVDYKEESIIAGYHVLDAIYHCCVGFLKRELTRFSDLYEGVLSQITDVHPGSYVAVIISCLRKMTINR